MHSVNRYHDYMVNPEMKVSPLVYEGEFKGVTESVHHVRAFIVQQTYLWPSDEDVKE